MEEAKVKAQFIAQYYGQSILRRTNWIDKRTISEEVSSYYECFLGSAYLVLRQVNNLTDEEKEHLAELIYGDSYEKEDGHITKLYQLASISQWLEKLSKLREQFFLCVTIYQYLLRIGILLPFTYLNENERPITIQPDEIITKGWVKIKSD